MKSKLPSDPKIYLALVGLVAFIVAMMPRTGKFNYDYRKGSPWAYETLVAQFDFPILKTSEQILAEQKALVENVAPYYKYSRQATIDAVRAAEAVDLDSLGSLKPVIVGALSEILEKGVLPELGSEGKSSEVLYIQRDKRASKYASSNVYTLASAREKLLSDAHSAFPSEDVDSLFSARGIYDLVVPNLEYDKETTELVHSQNHEDVSPTSGFASSGQLIVSRGELVTADIQQLLDSYKAEYENSLGYSGSRWLMWGGNFLIALAIVLLLFLAIVYSNPLIFCEFGKFLFIVAMAGLSAFAALICERTDPNLLYLIPFTLISSYLIAFFTRRFVLLIYMISLLPLLVSAHGGLELYVMFLVAGAVNILLIDYLNAGWRQFLCALLIFLTLVLTFTGFRLINDLRGFDAIGKVAFLFMSALLSVAGYPVIFLFEKIFGLVSTSRLQDLCDTNDNKLISELAQKTPGTFQHSLQVMNLCEAAARSIEANVVLIKAGALYHDIGKIGNPQCFIENESSIGVKYHDSLTPKQSSQDIIRHVTEGMVIADKYGLPEVVKDFIITHHGTSYTGYFYNKFVNEGGDPADKAEFTYPGRKPSTKEETILMLCDSLEAASRTLKDKSPEAFDAFVESMVKSKSDEGQFTDSSLSLRELDTIKGVLKTYLAQMYHQRVAYPKRKAD